MVHCVSSPASSAKYRTTPSGCRSSDQSQPSWAASSPLSCCRLHPPSRSGCFPSHWDLIAARKSDVKRNRTTFWATIKTQATVSMTCTSHPSPRHRQTVEIFWDLYLLKTKPVSFYTDSLSLSFSTITHTSLFASIINYKYCKHIQKFIHTVLVIKLLLSY